MNVFKQNKTTLIFAGVTIFGAVVFAAAADTEVQRDEPVRQAFGESVQIQAAEPVEPATSFEDMISAYDEGANAPDIVDEDEDSESDSVETEDFDQADSSFDFDAAPETDVAEDEFFYDMEQ